MGKAIVEFGVCGDSDRQAALQLVLADLPSEHRGPLMDSLAGQGGEPLAPFDALVTAKKANRLLAAAWAQPQPGRTASLWPPRRAPRAGRLLSEAQLARLVGVAVERADACGVSITQSLLETEDDPRIGPLKANGFERIASLRYLEWLPVAGFDPLDSGGPHQAGNRVVFEPNADDDPQRLYQVVEATYRETLDCPGLEGARNLTDALNGYRQVGDYDPALWFFVRRQGSDEDAGVLLLAEHGASRQMELVYMGIVHAARGHRLGLAAVRKGQALTSQRGLDRMVLAVDAANRPATKAYRDAGFTEWSRRVVYVRRRQ